MKKILSLLLIMMCVQVSAQSMKDIISNMPDSITPLITKNNRLNLIDYLEAGQKAIEKNRFGGDTEMTLLTDTRCIIKMTSSSTLDIKLLKSPEPAIGIITSVMDKEQKAGTSIVRYYSLDWKLVKTVVPENFKSCSWKDDSDEMETTSYDPLKLDNSKFAK